MTFTCHRSFSPAIISKYDGFILDQFGVLHNGKTSLEGAPDCVKELHAQGKKLIILSNTSSASDAALKKLPQLGFDPEHFMGAVTSGEEASHYLRETYTDGSSSSSSSKKTKALWITWPSSHKPDPRDFLQRCGDNIELVDPLRDDAAEQADVIIAHGSGVVRGPDSELDLGDFFTTGRTDQVLRPLLEKCRARDVPMVCANPDLVTINPDGVSKNYMPGNMARLYEDELGGQVSWFGKPHASHFEACLRELDLPRDRVAHVGDSLHHDVQGANTANIDCVFVVGGIHRDQLLTTEDQATEWNTLPNEDKLKAVIEEEGGFTPTHVVPMFRL